MSWPYDEHVARNDMSASAEKGPLLFCDLLVHQISENSISSLIESSLNMKDNPIMKQPVNNRRTEFDVSGKRSDIVDEIKKNEMDVVDCKEIVPKKKRPNILRSMRKKNNRNVLTPGLMRSVVELAAHTMLMKSSSDIVSTLERKPTTSNLQNAVNQPVHNTGKEDITISKLQQDILDLPDQVRKSGCIGKGIQIEIQNCEIEFNKRVQLDIIRMDVKDGQFQYIMLYMDRFTKYMLLRPLIAGKSKLEDIALELFKIFADFGIPNIIDVNPHYAEQVIYALRMLVVNFNCEHIDVHLQTYRESQEISLEGKDVLRRLKKWSDTLSSPHWATGCYIVQQYMNKKITIKDPLSPYIKVFSKNYVNKPMSFRYNKKFEDIRASEGQSIQMMKTEDVKETLTDFNRVDKSKLSNKGSIIVSDIEAELNSCINNANAEVMSDIKQTVQTKTKPPDKKNYIIEAVSNTPSPIIVNDEDSLDTIQDLIAQRDPVIVNQKDLIRTSTTRNTTQKDFSITYDAFTKKRDAEYKKHAAMEALTEKKKKKSNFNMAMEVLDENAITSKRGAEYNIHAAVDEALMEKVHQEKKPHSNNAKETLTRTQQRFDSSTIARNDKSCISFESFSGLDVLLN